METKYCSRCETTKNISEFRRVKSRKSGYEIYCTSCKNEIDKSHRQQLREDAIAAYGGACCANCGEDTYELLVIDHLNNDGSVDRKKRGTGQTFLQSLKREGWPSGYQVLCVSCNFLKQWHPRVFNKRTIAG